MRWINSNWLRLKAFVLRRRFDRDLEDELAFHLHRLGVSDILVVIRRI